MQRALPGLAAPARPFLKWAGGKSSIAREIGDLIRSQLRGRYFEPFLGGGAVFFALGPDHAVLSDSNMDLIETYTEVRDNLDLVIRSLRGHARRHSTKYYYEVRDKNPRTPAARAARMIYLNHTCFNGLWRVNSKGQFNVPMGSYVHPNILDETLLRLASRALAGVKLVGASFEEVLSESRGRPKAGDVVYADPPYDPLSKTANFTAYTRREFGKEQQLKLASVLTDLAREGVFVIASNSDTPFIRGCYPEAAFETRRLMVARAINSVGTGRGAVPELLLVSRQVRS